MRPGAQVQARVVAVEWVNSLSCLDAVAEEDKPYVQAVIIAAAVFHYPAPQLAGSVLDAGQHYDVTIKGYKKMIDDELWTETFVSRDRDDELSHVQKSLTQLTDIGAIKVLQVRKVRFHQPTDYEAVSGGEARNHKIRVTRKRHSGR